MVRRGRDRRQRPDTRDRSAAEARPSYDELLRENARLRDRLGKLERLIDALQRQTKRQAAPFSRGEPKRSPSRPGRKGGAAYGTRARRPVPSHVDETTQAPLPGRCPGCAGALMLERVADHYEEDLPAVRPHVRRFQIQIGRCEGCGKRVQARHRAQSSDAIGAAQVSLGPRATALAATLNKELGVPHGKVAKILGELGGLSVTPGGVAGAVARAAAKAEPSYDAICDGVAASAVVAPDETGWRIGGEHAWLHAFVGDGVTAYEIARGRGFAEASAVLGERFAGVLERDGWTPYRRFADAQHQSCTAHLLRRCAQMRETCQGGQARVPRAVEEILKSALDLRDARARITARTFGRRLAALERRMDAVLAMRPVHPPNRRLIKHLRTERDHLFTFLKVDGVEATNWRAEQAIRPAVIARKHWGGNLTSAGAHVSEVLLSLTRSCRQQGLDAVEVIAELMRAPCGTVAPLALPASTR